MTRHCAGEIAEKDASYRSRCRDRADAERLTPPLPPACCRKPGWCATEARAIADVRRSRRDSGPRRRPLVDVAAPDRAVREGERLVADAETAPLLSRRAEHPVGQIGVAVAVVTPTALAVPAVIHLGLAHPAVLHLDVRAHLEALEMRRCRRARAPPSRVSAAAARAPQLRLSAAAAALANTTCPYPAPGTGGAASAFPPLPPACRSISLFVSSSAAAHPSRQPCKSERHRPREPGGGGEGRRGGAIWLLGESAMTRWSRRPETAAAAAFGAALSPVSGATLRRVESACIGMRALARSWNSNCMYCSGAAASPSAAPYSGGAEKLAGHGHCARARLAGARADGPSRRRSRPREPTSAGGHCTWMSPWRGARSHRIHQYLESVPRWRALQLTSERNHNISTALSLACRPAAAARENAPPLASKDSFITREEPHASRLRRHRCRRPWHDCDGAASRRQRAGASCCGAARSGSARSHGWTSLRVARATAVRCRASPWASCGQRAAPAAPEEVHDMNSTRKSSAVVNMRDGVLVYAAARVSRSPLPAAPRC